MTDLAAKTITLEDLDDRLAALEAVHDEQARLGRVLDPHERSQLVARHRAAKAAKEKQNA